MATDKKLTGLRFPEDILWKMKHIGEQTKRTLTNTVIIACEEHIADYEKRNGKIQRPKEDKYTSLDRDTPPTPRRKK